jgi:hypothetical protein
MTSMDVGGGTLALAQLLLATVVLASYAFALGELVGVRGRARAAVVGLIAATGIVGTCESWQMSFVILGSVPLITGLFACAAWILWKLTLRTTRLGVTVAPDPPLGAVRFTKLISVRSRSQMRPGRVRTQRQPR